ncbi:uncharacterized protein LOC133361208 [Lethenteron reissneri]|uniref:uncharacterized protein LOC133361208 n=1 Tax=Lethenteron reissneri TaxID=7753 RepID=UPI002AB70205|nr:uncharacterized protein LOC133361208 [Lethenteron reissneri]
MPAEKPPAVPAEKPPAMPAEKPPAVPAEKPPAKPAEKRPAEKPPARPAEKRPAEKRPAEKRPAEKRPAEKRPAEKRPARPAKKPPARPAKKPPARKPPAMPAEKTAGDAGGETAGDAGGETAGVAGGETAGDAGGETAGDAGGETAGDAGGETAGDAGGETAGGGRWCRWRRPRSRRWRRLLGRVARRTGGGRRPAAPRAGRVDGAGRGSSAMPTLPPAAARRPGFKMTTRTAPDLSQTSLARVQRLRCSGVAKAPRKAKLISPKPLAKLRGNTYMLACQETRRRAQQLGGGGGSTHGRGRAGGGAGAERAARVHREKEEDRAAGGVPPAPPLSAAAWRNDGGARGGDELEDENFFRLSQSPPIPQQSQEEHYMSDRDEFRFSDDEAGEEATAERRSGLPAVLGDLPPGVHFKPGTFAAAVAAVAATTAAKDNASGSASATDATSSSELVERGGAEPGWRWWGDDGEWNDGDLLNLTQRDPVDMDVDEDDPGGDDVVPMEVDEAPEGAGGADERRLGTAPPGDAGPRAQATARVFARPGPSRNALLTGDIAKAAVAQPPAPTGARVGAAPAQRPPSAAPGGGLSPLDGILSLIDDSRGRFCPAGALSAAGVLSEAAAAGMEVGGAAPAVRSAAVVETRALEQSVARGRDPHGGVDFGAITEPLFFINQVLRWEVQALQRGVGGPPSGLCGSEPRFSVPLHFPSHEAYVQVFLPLLLLESWEQLASDMAEERRRNRPAFRMRLKCSSNRQGLSCGEFERILPAAAAAASPPLGLGDVLILWLPTAGAGVGSRSRGGAVPGLRVPHHPAGHWLRRDARPGSARTPRRRRRPLLGVGADGGAAVGAAGAGGSLRGRRRGRDGGAPLLGAAGAAPQPAGRGVAGAPAGGLHDAARRGHRRLAEARGGVQQRAADGHRRRLQHGARVQCGAPAAAAPATAAAAHLPGAWPSWHRQVLHHHGHPVPPAACRGPGAVGTATDLRAAGTTPDADPAVRSEQRHGGRPHEENHH